MNLTDSLSRGTLVMAALLLDLGARERQTEGKLGISLGPMTLGRGN